MVQKIQSGKTFEFDSGIGSSDESILVAGWINIHSGKRA